MAARMTLLALLLLTLAVPAAGIEARLPRHPAPSPDGSTVAFSWQGDLWLVPAQGGEARRLTAHPAADRHPVWSRDGGLIAFASVRHGNEDVFVLDPGGSEPPRRLTWADTPDLPVDFTPDGSAVLFSSRRDEGVRWMPALYTVPVRGGTPALAQPSLGEAGAYSPSGDALAYVRGSTKWSRRGYRGAANREIWLRESSGEERALTRFEGDDDHPGWVDAETLVFLSARPGRKNVFLLDLAGGGIRALTAHEGSDARAPRVSADGSLVAYEFEDAIWTVRPSGGEPSRLSIQVPSDRVRNNLERREESKGAGELALGPEAERMALVVHGEVFVTPIWPKEDQEIAAPPTGRVTETPFRERAVAWSPDGKTLVYGSDRDGQEELYTARPKGESPWDQAFRFEETRLTETAEAEYEARYSPDGLHLAYVRGSGTLVVAGADGSDPRPLLEHWTPPDYAWSPDGRWIAYSVPDTAYNHEVFIVSVEGGEPYNVSRHPDDDTGPRWSPDGKRLVWVSSRHQDTRDIWGVWLTRADQERTPEGWLRLWKDEKEQKKKRGKGRQGGEEVDEEDEGESDTEKDEKRELPAVSIDFEDLWERVTAITSFPGDEGSPRVSPDGRTVVFTAEHEGERDLYAVRWDGKEPRRLTEGGERPRAVQIDAEGDAVFYLNGQGQAKRVSLEGKAGDPLPFRARFTVDRQREREAIVREAWRVLDLRFYDPDFHGVNWKAQLDLYLPWALGASDPADFADVLNLMLGELNASHMGYYPAADEGGERTGWIGALFDPGAGRPGLLVREVLRDSPAARQDVALEPGERLLEVGGRPLDGETNVYSLLADTVGRRVPLLVRGADGEEREVVVIPVDGPAEQQLRYGQWTRQRREMVERLSGGRLGYLHIQGMDLRSFEEFERNLHAAGAGREGLVIDVRSNGGGWTTDLLLAVLQVRRHAYTIPRGAASDTRDYPQSRLPLSAWTRPVVVLCNEDSYSNAEIFSHAIKTLGRGLLVGAPTFGAVISTGAARLLDGGYVRVPGRGWFVAGSGVNMERQGAVPDILVEQPPAQDTSAEEDDQLERAVSEFLAVIESDPRHGSW